MEKENCVLEINSERLSTLPEDVAIRILSFLETKYAVQTSVLSKRWRNLWMLVPDLYFDCSAFKKVAPFVRFVRLVLARRDRSININNFNFMAWGKSMYDVQSFVDYVVSHNVQNLIVEAKRPRIPDCEFDLHSAQTLKTLKVKYAMYPTRVMCFQQLVNLHLEMANTDCRDPFSSCPNLKNLTMIQCSCYCEGLPFKIFAPQLLTLTLSHCEILYGPCPTLELTAPRLTSLRYERSFVPIQFQTDPLPCIASVHIDLDVSGGSRRNEVRLILFLSLLQQLCNATSVTLSMSTVKLLSGFPDLLAKESSPFRNLKFLNIVRPPWPKSTRLAPHVEDFLLKNSPCLEIAVELRRRTKRKGTC